MYHSAFTITYGMHHIHCRLAVWMLAWGSNTNDLERSMPTLWAQTSNFENISVGDELPILVKFEFRMPIPDGAGALAISPKEEMVTTEKLSGYFKELLLKGFPASSVNDEGTTVAVTILTEFLPGDTVSLNGRVVGKVDDGDGQRVECEITVESEKGDVLAMGQAVVSL